MVLLLLDQHHSSWVRTTQEILTVSMVYDPTQYSLTEIDLRNIISHNHQQHSSLHGKNCFIVCDPTSCPALNPKSTTKKASRWLQQEDLKQSFSQPPPFQLTQYKLN